MSADIDECKERTKCQCADCHCDNTWGGYDCHCSSDDLLYMREHDTCISKLISLCTNVLVMISHLIATVTMFSGNPSDSFSVIYK